MAARPRGHKQKKLNDVCIHFFCLRALGLVIKLNFSYIESSLLADNWFGSKQGIEVSAEQYLVTLSRAQV